jgi:hypothetical protein
VASFDCSSISEYSAAASRGLYAPETKFGWSDDDGSGAQVFGTNVDVGGGRTVRRRKFGKVLKLQEAGLIANFHSLPLGMDRDGMYRDIFDSKYFEPTLDAKPYMATFDTNQPVNQGQVFRTVRPSILLHTSMLSGYSVVVMHEQLSASVFLIVAILTSCRTFCARQPAKLSVHKAVLMPGILCKLLASHATSVFEPCITHCMRL